MKGVLKLKAQGLSNRELGELELAKHLHCISMTEINPNKLECRQWLNKVEIVPFPSSGRMEQLK